MAIIATASKVILEDYQHRRWIVYAIGIAGLRQRQRAYKTYALALSYATVLLHHYQIENLTEVIL